ncbi:5'-nucleotidase C-terminal domain-containing protein [Desulforhopalus sp. 52FAK]
MTRTDLDTRRVAMRTGENAFANLVADALRKFYNSDIALINGGGFRANKKYPSGSNLTIGDIQKELPFNNRVVNVKVTGAMLKTTLETGLSRIKEIKGCFPHISGITVEYNPALQPRHRILSITKDGQPLDPEKAYTLTTIDFLANGGDGYNELKNAKRIINIGDPQLLWEYVRNFIIEEGAISPEIDGRMKVVSQTSP